MKTNLTSELRNMIESPVLEEERDFIMKLSVFLQDIGSLE
jgi:hypothetical protein